MLVIGRKRDEKLIIDGNIEITILKVGRNHVKFGVTAPRDVRIQTRMGGTGNKNVAAGEVTEAVVPRDEAIAEVAAESEAAEIAAPDPSD